MVDRETILKEAKSQGLVEIRGSSEGVVGYFV